MAAAGGPWLLIFVAFLTISLTQSRMISPSPESTISHAHLDTGRQLDEWQQPSRVLLEDVEDAPDEQAGDNEQADDVGADSEAQGKDENENSAEIDDGEAGDKAQSGEGEEGVGGDGSTEKNEQVGILSRCKVSALSCRNTEALSSNR